MAALICSAVELQPLFFAMAEIRDAPGGPGIEPRWTSSAKAGVGAALEATSRVWYTVSHGILNEVYYPRLDEACTRDVGLIVTDGAGYFSEEKRDTVNQVKQIADGVPGYILTNEAMDGCYTIEKRIIADPARDVVLQQIFFSARRGVREDYRVFVLLSPHLVNGGKHNTGWIETVKGWRMLFASGDGTTLALAASRPFLAASAGFVGTTDGYQILRRHGSLEETYDRAADGNVALCAELALAERSMPLLLSLGFGRTAMEAGLRARASIGDGYEAAERVFVRSWHRWQETLEPLDGAQRSDLNPYRVSTAVLRTHEATSIPGGFIASLSIPWGFSKGDDDLGGYHLVWPRDLVETGTGLLAIGAHGEARRILTYLETTQEADGHWPQNMWVDGTPYWSGLQMDECAFPILLADLAFRQTAIDSSDLSRYWPMIRKAAQFVVQNGPVTAQDRWEEDGGYSSFTLAVEIAALVVAADIATKLGHHDDGGYLLETADLWNGSIERWTFARDTELARQLGISGYYVRITPAETSDAPSPLQGFVAIKNRGPGEPNQPVVKVLSPDALALVRFGLRAADDPRIRDTITAIDSFLKVELPQGPLWYRYTGDGYGEHEDGAPFDGNGIGRAWPLLTGERAHYEIARGDFDKAERLRITLEQSGNRGCLLPEQVWDCDDIPARELFRGQPSGSAMPLVWAHSEHVKLLRSLRDERVFDMPPQTVLRYQVEKRESDLKVWRYSNVATTLCAGRRLRVEVFAPALVHWSADGWRDPIDTRTRPTGFGMHFADLDTAHLEPGAEIVFTFFWLEADKWEGKDFCLRVVDDDSCVR